MKTYIKFLLLTAILSFLSCEEVIDVDVPTATSKLVIEASIDWEKGTSGNNQSIKLSTSSAYFDTETNTMVIGASVKVENTDTNEIFVFADNGDGTYSTSSFVPIIGNNYSLEVIYNNETYIATETLIAVPNIKNITQSTEGAFDDELLEVNVYFDDPIDEENYYLTRFYEENDLFATFNSLSDEFLNGNEIYVFFEKDKDEENNQASFQPGDTVEINLYGISERYYNYIRLLLEQYGSGGGPFSSSGAKIKGNCINQTNKDNEAFGYFRLTEVNKTSYMFQ
ncbi:hypothetical protein APS56_10880 [Pseudalgibacter alginicilyticus]|uniref:DUF4249 domain-containing protein n=1 Tax=Pseudalgibacter alginicilyticus TaxID=1736674 RepID=A0A0P0CRY0_9FLAO|nr:DUF4249 domain-containing protein [Pseudalgibacter alginicilyticus]ALJ05597.1 hypothetical protein APS56_10880 [Pseudalgibacter alginicilyticus]